MPKYILLPLLFFFVNTDVFAQQQIWKESISNYSLNNISANDSILVITAENATFVSKDGKSWDVGYAQLSDEDYLDYPDMKVKKNTFYRMINQIVSSSADGINWVSRMGSSGMMDYDIDDNDKVIAINHYSYLQVSENGVSSDNYWDFPLNQDASICFGNNRWVILNQSYGLYSDDGGHKWNTFNIDFNGKYVTAIAEIKYLDNKFIAVSADSTIQYSVDGLQWTATGNPKIGKLKKVYKFGSEFIATTDASNPYTCLKSIDGIQWNIHTFNPLPILQTSPLNLSGFRDIAKFNSRYYALNGSQILSSADFVNWELESEMCRFMPQLADLTHIDKIYDYDSITLSLTGDCDIMHYSLNKGNTWKNCVIDTVNDGAYRVNSNLQYGNNIWAVLGHSVGVTNNAVYRSLDGIHWTIHILPFEPVYSMRFANNKFYLLTREFLYESADALNWSMMINITNIKAGFPQSESNIYSDFIYEDTLRILSGARSSGNMSFGKLLYFDSTNTWQQYGGLHDGGRYVSLTSNANFYYLISRWSMAVHILNKQFQPVTSNLYDLYNPYVRFADTCGSHFNFTNNLQNSLISTADFLTFNVVNAPPEIKEIFAFRKIAGSTIVKSIRGMHIVSDVPAAPQFQNKADTKYYGSIISYNSLSEILEIGNAANSNLKVYIYDLMGHLQKSILSNAHPVNISLQSLQTGVYIIKVTDNNKIIDTKKIIVN